MKTQTSVLEDDDLLIVRFYNGDEDYCLWQVEKNNESKIYFEFDDQKNGGYNIVKECSIMYDGIHLVLNTNELFYFYINNLSKKDYLLAKSSMENIYSKTSSILEIIKN